MAQSARSKKADLINSSWLGKPGRRHNFQALVFYVGTYQRNSVYQHIMKDRDGNIIVYSAPKRLAGTMTRLHFSARVIKHRLYKGIRQTLVTDLKLETR